MGRARKNIAYTYFDECDGETFRCKIPQCKKIVKNNNGASNLVAHMKTHKQQFREYVAKKEGASHEQPKITEHVAVTNRILLDAKHPRQKQFLQNLIGCVAQPSQSVDFFTRPNLQDQPAPFRKLIRHLDSTIHVPPARTLTRYMLATADEYKLKVI
jgi:hypothetical protein